MLQIKQGLAAVTRVALSVLLIATMFGIFPNDVQKAYAADGDNLSFELVAVSSEDGTVITYSLREIVVSNETTYKSIMVSFPSVLDIRESAPLDWALTKDESSTISTYSYVVADTASAADVTRFLEDLSFLATEPPDGSAGIKVSISPNMMSSFVDANENEHFYEVVTSSGNVDWMSAYNAAKQKTYRGMRGYLATITSQEEQNMIYRTITSDTAWLGGTRMLMATSSGSGVYERINDDDSVLPFTALTGSIRNQNTAYSSNYDFRPATANEWYWANGPEAGQTFYDSATYTTTNNSSGTAHINGTTVESRPTYHGEYGFFNAGNTTVYDYEGHYYDVDGERLRPAGSVTGNLTGNRTTIYSGGANEPNNSSPTGKDGGEYVLQFAYDSRPTWNDFPYNGAVKNYIVEYGGYNPADIGNGKHPLPDVNEHEELPPVPVKVHYASRLTPDAPLTGLKTIQLTGNKVGDPFVAEPLEIEGYTFVGFDASNNKTDPVAVYHEGSYTWTDAEGEVHTKDHVVIGQISGWVQDITFLYQPKSSTVTFHPNYRQDDPDYWEGLGTVAPQTKTVTYDSGYGTLATASREGYTLAGWSLEPDGSEPVTSATIVKKASDHNLYAIWQPKTDYGVHYDLNGGKLNIASADYTTLPDKTKIGWDDAGLLSGTPGSPGGDYSEQDSPVWGTPEREFYFFTGWYVSLNGAGSDVTNTNTYGDLAANDRNAFIELRAQWSRINTFAVKYQLNGGTIDGQAAIPNKNDLSEDDNALIPEEDPVQPGYRFQGWKLVKHGTEEVPDGAIVTSHDTYGQISVTEPDDGTITLEAQWAPQSYTVQYDLDGGLIDGSADVNPKTVLYTDRNLTQGLNPTRPDDQNGDSWTFSGWVLAKRGDADVAAPQNVTAADSYGELAGSDDIGSITLQAQWTLAIRYMVSYDLNGGTIEDDTVYPDKTVGYTDAALLPVDDGGALISPERTGYDFAGWRQLYKNGTLSADTIGQSHQYDWLSESPTDRYVTLQAQWTAKTGFTVQYDLNNPVPGQSTLPDKSVSWESTNLLPTSQQMLGVILPDGKHLAGWELVQIGNDPVTPPYDEVFNTASYGSLVADQTNLSIILRAIWEDDTVWTVQYDSNGGTPANIGSVSLTSDTQTVLSSSTTIPTRVGYDFDGWTVVENRNADKTAEYRVTDTDTFADLVAESQYQPFYTIKLQAQWTPKTTFTVNYTSSGVVGDPVASLLPKENVAWSGASLLPDAAPTWDHRTLVGWKLVSASTDSSLDAPLPESYPVGENAFITEGYSYATLADYIHTTYPDLLSVNQSDEISSVTLQPVWVEEAQYTVAYDLDGGTYNDSGTLASSTVYWSDEVLPKDNGGGAVVPVKPGYTFTGWKVSANASPEAALLDKVEHEPYSYLAVSPGVSFIRLKAQWVAKEYTVNYDLNYDDDTYPSDPASYAQRTDVGYNQANLFPVNPSQNPKRLGSGYAFAGWYTAKDDTGTRVEAATAYRDLVDDDSVDSVTLYAHWMNSKATVTFDKNNSDEDSTNATPTSIEVNMGEPYGGVLDQGAYPHPLPIGNDAPSRIGYTFNGWYTAPVGGTRVYDDTIVSIAGDHTLYARWTPKNGYEVRYDYQDVPGNLATPQTPLKAPLAWNATQLLPTEPTRTGWRFDGWWTKSGGQAGGGAEVTAFTQYSALAINEQGVVDDRTMSATIYAHWVPKEAYEVVYDLNGADHVDGSPVSEGAAVVPLDDVSWLQTELMPTQTVEKYGYGLTGWKLVLRDASPVTNGTVVWTDNDDSVSYADLAETENVVQLTLQAQWSATTDNTLSFDSNHDDASAAPGQMIGLTYDAAVGALPAAGGGAPTLEGYEFAGWVQEAGFFTPGVGTVTADGGDTPATPDFTSASTVNWVGDKTVFAVWTATDDNTLKFDSNHADASTPPGQMTGLTYDKAVGALPAEGSGAPTLEGYTFVGWDRDENHFTPGVGTVTEDGGDEPVPPGFTSVTTVDWVGEETVYAVWSARTDMTLKFNANGGTAGSVPQKGGLVYDKAVGELPAAGSGAPTRAGYEFVGWAEAANHFTPGVGTVAHDGDSTPMDPDFDADSIADWAPTTKTVFAVWKAKSYTINYLSGSVTEGETTREGYWYADAVPTIPFDKDTGWGNNQDLSATTGEKLTEIPFVDNATWETPNLVPPRWLYMDNIGTNAYYFAGWVLVDNDTHVPISDTNIVVPETTLGDLIPDDSSTEITLMGTWTKSYAVFYELAGGSYSGSGYDLSADYYPNRTDAVAFRATPVRTGYIFAGWQLSMRDASSVSEGPVYQADGSATYEDLAKISDEAIAENVTLRAQWTPRTDMVLGFHANGGAAGSMPQKGGLTFDAPVGELPAEGSGAPTLTGYVFAGWDQKPNHFTPGVGTVTEDGGITPVDPDFNADSIANWAPTTKTVYAVWAATADNTLSFRSNHEDASTPPGQMTGLTYDKAVGALPGAGSGAPTLEGYEFAGWAKAANHFTPGVGTVTADGGDTPATPDFTSASTVDWVGDKTVFAVWTATDDNTLKFSSNHADASTPPGQMTGLTYDKAVGALPAEGSGAPTLEGYEFAGWAREAGFFTPGVGTVAADGGDTPMAPDFNASSTVDWVGEKTVYAVWTPRTDMVLKFHANGGTDGSTTQKGGLTYDKAVGELPAVGSGAPTRAGYEFVGWAQKAGHFTPGVGTVEEIGDSTPMDPDFDADSIADWAPTTKTVFAVWTATDDNTLKFDSNHADATTPPAPMIGLVYDKAVGTLPGADSGAPTLEGYEFAGWAKAANHFTPGVGTVTADGGDTPAAPDFNAASTVDWTGEKTVFTVWTAASNELVFDSNGGTGSMANQTFATDQTQALSANTYTRNGYDFAGWATAADGAVAYEDQDSYTYSPNPYTASVTLYASWTPKKGYEVKYDPDGGSLNSSSVRSNVQWDSTNLIPADPERAGYSFAGWQLTYRDATSVMDGTELTTDDNSTVTYGSLAELDTFANITLTARWIENGSYEVHYNLNGAPGSIEKKTVKWTDSSLLPSPAPTYPGHILLGWDVVSNGSKTGVTDADTYGSLAADEHETRIVLQAQWARENSYTVRYDLNGGDTRTPASQANLGYTATNLLPLPDSEAPARAGYTFLGWWYEDANTQVNATTAYSDLVASDVPAITLTARWEPKAYTVVYDLADGDPAGTPANPSGIAPATVNWSSVAGSEFIPGAAPVREGVITGSDTPSNPGGTPYKYQFLGWSVTRTSGGNPVTALVRDGDTYADLAGDENTASITLKALWLPVPTDGTQSANYAVVYDVNQADTLNGSGSFDELYLIDNFDDYGNPLNTTDLVPARKGYDFAGWDVVKNGYGSNVTSERYSQLAYDEETYYIVLQAQWTPMEFTVHYGANGGQLTSEDHRGGVYWNTNWLLPASDPVREGYSFREWHQVVAFSDSDAVSPFAIGSAVSNNDKYSVLAEDDDSIKAVYLEAVWDRNSYTVSFVDGLGTVLKSDQVLYGDAAVAPRDPQRSGYTFMGWDKAFDRITEDTIVTALWQLIPADPPGGNGENGGGEPGGKPIPLPPGTMYPGSQPGSSDGDSEPDESAADAVDTAGKPDKADTASKGGSTSTPDRGSGNSSSGDNGNGEKADQPVWSLLNLLLLVGTALLAVLGFVLARKRADDEDENEENTAGTVNEGAYYGFGYDAQRHDEHRKTTVFATMCKVLAVVIALVLLVVFVLFEDFRNPMVFIDWISPVFIGGFILTIVAFALARHTRKSEEDKGSGGNHTKNAPAV